MKEKNFGVIEKQRRFYIGTDNLGKTGRIENRSLEKYKYIEKKKAMRLMQSTIKAISWCGNRIL